MKTKATLYSYNLEIHGMKCGMCESHINTVIRQNFDVKKVKSSHRKNETLIVSYTRIDIDKLKSIIASTGYSLKEVKEI